MIDTRFAAVGKVLAVHASSEATGPSERETPLDGDLLALTPPWPLKPGVPLPGRYQLQSALGRGAVGHVFRAFDRATRWMSL